MKKYEYDTLIKKYLPFNITSQIRLYPKPSLWDEKAWEVCLYLGTTTYTRELSHADDYKMTMTEICIFIENSLTKYEYTLKRIIMRDINS